MISNLDLKYFKLTVGQERIKHETDSDVSARCPICGDSKHSHSKARLHIYSKNDLTFVNCFNSGCPCQNKTVWSFLRDFYPDLFNQYKKERNLLKIETAQNEETDVFKDIKTETTVKHDLVKHDLLTFDFSKYFKKIEESKEGMEYLKSRCIHPDKKYGQWYFGTQNLEIGNKLYKFKDNIIIPLYVNNEMYGLYARNIYEKKFYTYMPEQNNGFKIWNWFGIDINRKVYVFEGIFDALSAIQCGLDNCIACMGAKIPDKRINELKDIVFCLDNDKTGLSNMLNYAKKGYSCFVPSIDSKDMNECLKQGTNVKELILNNTYTGILAQVKISSIL